MSLNSLASSRVAAEGARRNRPTEALSDDTVPRSPTPDPQNGLSALVEYLPAETVSLYLATLSTLPTLSATFPIIQAPGVYVTFAVLTPVLLLLIYAGKRHAAKQPRWPGMGALPWWPMIAATIAFCAWGLAVPQAPFITSESGHVISSFAALVVSALLGVVGRLFSNPTT